MKHNYLITNTLYNRIKLPQTKNMIFGINFVILPPMLQLVFLVVVFLLICFEILYLESLTIIGQKQMLESISHDPRANKFSDFLFYFIGSLVYFQFRHRFYFFYFYIFYSSGCNIGFYDKVINFFHISLVTYDKNSFVSLFY